ncbi:hypothetical protein AN958_04314, partial [Leucoagaricus sp. SymC.cos]
ISYISDAELDELVKHFKEDHPNSGICYLVGALHGNGLRIQRYQVIESLQQVDPLGLHLHNVLWHMDRHHKLIRWGIVIYGVVDGYSQMVHISFVYFCLFLLLLSSISFLLFRLLA